MMHVVHLTPGFAVASQIKGDDVAALAAQGFQTIIAVRPDGEDLLSPTALQIQMRAGHAGLTFLHVPATAHDVTDDETVDRFEQALSGARGPVLAYCKSGTRSALLWGLAAARHYERRCVEDALRQAGIDPDVIEDELRAQTRAVGAHPAALTVLCQPLAAA